MRQTCWLLARAHGLRVGGSRQRFGGGRSMSACALYRMSGLSSVPQFTGSSWVVLGPGRLHRQSEIGALDAPEYVAAGGVEAMDVPGVPGAVVNMAVRRGQS